VLYEFFSLFGNARRLGKNNLVAFDILEMRKRVCSRPPRVLMVNHLKLIIGYLEENDSQCPNIAFISIFLKC
jgi:hypothetical protein